VEVLHAALAATEEHVRALQRGRCDRAVLEAALADLASPVAGYPDGRWFLKHVAPLLDDDRARWIGSVSGEKKDELLRSSRAMLFPAPWPEPAGRRSARRWAISAVKRR
jgi:hypothetical protein